MSLRVIGVGDNVVDKYLHTGMMYPGGNALNFAVYAVRLGATAAYLGVFGDDTAAKMVRVAALAEGVSLEGCLTRQGENGYACVGLSGGERTFLCSNKGGIAGREPLVLTSENLQYLEGFDLVCTGINSRMLTELPKLGMLSVPVAFDFSEQHSAEMLRDFCPDIDYAILSCGKLSLKNTLLQIEMTHQAGSPFVLATRGSQGALFSDGERTYLHPAHIITARDSLGAGDAYLTAFLLSYVAWQSRRGVAAPAAERKRAIHMAMANAAGFAATICLIDGAFGRGGPMDIIEGDDGRE